MREFTNSPALSTCQQYMPCITYLSGHICAMIFLQIPTTYHDMRVHPSPVQVS